ncbi:DMT family transporter [Musicola keenii]|uniref:DMT family transporter n=1 Tax=Musicola keenii TaxID=2884250 RepID=UPI0017842B50|nr:DMT family transporter [Musicola keenii]
MRDIIRQRRVAELWLACVAAGWGIGFPAMKQAVNEHSVLMVLGLRFVLSAFLLLPFSANKLRNMPMKTLAAGIVLGLLLGAAFVFLIFGLQLTTASNTGFLAGLSVIWVLLLSGPLAGKLPSFEAALATLFGLVGLYLMSDIHGWQLQWGDTLVVIGSVFTAIHIMALDKLSTHHDNMILAFLQIATIALVIMVIQYSRWDAVLPAMWDSRLVLAVFVTAIFSTVIAFWVQTRYQRYTTPTRAILIYNLEPVFSALFAVWLLRETLSANILLGGGLILLGMCLPGMITTFTQRYSKEKNIAISD